MGIMSGTYRERRPDQPVHEVLEVMATQLDHSADGKLFENCVTCGQPFNDHGEHELALDWRPDATVFQLSNACWRVVGCGEAA